MRHPFVFRGGIIVVILALCSACHSSRPETASVQGHVAYEGKTITEGTVTFYPEHGRPAIGAIDPSGLYRLTTFDTDDGTLPGKYKVTIEARRVASPAAPKDMKDEVNMVFSAAKIEWLVPEKYSRPGSSPLTAEVVAGSNTIDFTLP